MIIIDIIVVIYTYIRIKRSSTALDEHHTTARPTVFAYNNII